MHRNIRISDKFDTQLFFIGAEDHFIGSATSAKAVKIQGFVRFDQFYNSPCNFSFPPVLIYAMIATRLGKKHMILINE